MPVEVTSWERTDAHKAVKDAKKAWNWTMLDIDGKWVGKCLYCKERLFLGQELYSRKYIIDQGGSYHIKWACGTCVFLEGLK